MKLPVLALCAMMRNEEGNVDRCLSSVKDLVDFSVIVDTGSTDRSVEKARDYGAIVYPSMNMNWRKPPMFDFSHCRNESLQYCQEMGADWVLIQDLDEELQPMEASPEEFKLKLGKIPRNIHALGTLVHESKNGKFSASWWGVRFFKVTEGCHYTGRVHNHPHLIGGYSAASDITLFHYGYSDPALMDKKRDRALSLLENRLKDNPNDYEALYYKALTLIGKGDLQGGTKIGEQVIRVLDEIVNGDPVKLEFYGKLYYAIGSSYINLWNKDHNQEYADLATQWLFKGLELFPGDIDLNYYTCLLYWMAENKEKLIEHADRYRKAVRKYHSNTSINFDKFANIVVSNDLALNSRGVYCASDSYQENVDRMVQMA